MPIQKTIVALIFLCLSGYVMASKYEKFEQLSKKDFLDYKTEKMIRSLELKRHPENKNRSHTRIFFNSN